MTEDKQDEEPPSDGTVLSPDDLDITNEDSVVEIEDGRYVISPSGAEPAVTDVSESTPKRVNQDGDEQSASLELSEDAVHAWIEERLESADSKYAFDVTANFEGRISQKALFSNDVVTTFENLVIWYAHYAGGDTPVEDVLGILLVESNLSVRFPPDALRAFAESQGLDERESLESLYEAAREAGGIRFSAGDR